jgi:hypothetical protein
MPYIFQDAERRFISKDFKENEYINESGHTECVIFIQKAAKAPRTTLWIAGLRVKDAKPGDITPGTAIATFNDAGKYPTEGRGQQHAAIYLSHTSVSIRVLEQYNAQNIVTDRYIKFNNAKSGKRSNNADTYYVIEDARKK